MNYSKVQLPKILRMEFFQIIIAGLRSGNMRNAARSLVIAGTTLALTGVVHSEETKVEKAEAASNQAQTKLKRGGRKLKKKVLDATGNQSKMEDMKDGMKNVQDQTSDKAKELKNKID